MIEVLQRVAEIRRKSGQYQAQLAQQFSLALDAAPVAGLGICFNTATLTMELLSYYHDLWGRLKSAPGTNVEQARQENAERVGLITKALFILVLSGYEFAAKHALARNPRRLNLKRGRVYLAAILDASEKAGLITAQALGMWAGVLKLRNTLVHNNGVAEETGTFNFDDTVVAFRAGQMIEGNLLTFAALTEWATDSFKDWCLAFLG